MTDARKALPEYLVTPGGRRVRLRETSGERVEAVTLSKNAVKALRKAQGGPEGQRDD